ncbi:MAG: hypothetical protein U5K54_04925 [Cytophagales bacterium]|nr:hypothetical protein [Cytophagales bacterium]
MGISNPLLDFIIGDWDRHDDQWRWAHIDVEDNEKSLSTHTTRS